MLGSFPPKKEKWSMEFFYPNWINDMWRIWGIVFYNDKHYFEIKGEKCFDKDKIVSFCKEKGFALYDTASEVIRLKDNASDKFLEVVEPTDIRALLRRVPQCRVIVTTGEKATTTLCNTLSIPEMLSVGQYVPIPGLCVDGYPVVLYRLPSSSRAYPLSLPKKAEAYRQMFKFCGVE